MNWKDLLITIEPLDAAAMEATLSRQGVLTKLAGSLGRLEDLSVQLAGKTAQSRPKLTDKGGFGHGQGDDRGGAAGSGDCGWVYHNNHSRDFDVL